ncbi:MAG TPA: hypothetical protein VMB66_09120 [Candidatus Acidoferrales bacterium]|nr:hypothetical protein [Candidatus Acidoferrales bacterium]
MNRARWGLIETVVVVGLFVWLRWYSTFWQNRWVGLSLGLAFVSIGLTSRDSVRRQLVFALNFDLPKRVTILGAIAFTWMCISALRGFLGGPPFFSSAGARAAGDDGFFTPILCVMALQYLYASWFILTKRYDQSSQDPPLPPNHAR